MAFVLIFISTICVSGYKLPTGYIQHEYGCAWAPGSDFQPKETIKTQLPYLNPVSLPVNFSWTTAGMGDSALVTPPRNQLLPNPCGACWAIASTGALSDRLKISTYSKTGSIPVDINLSPQYLLDVCFYNSYYECGSCDGGSANEAYAVIHQTSISDESCSSYIGRELSFWAEVPKTEYICRTCSIKGNCYLTQPNPDMNFSVEEHGHLYYKDFYPMNTKTNVTMVEAMMQEIYQRGPITAGMYAHSDSFRNYSGGYVLVDDTKYNGTTHELVLVGWGQTSDGLSYWIGRNSFGTIWGNRGFFLAQRGVNIYNMETSCDWATIKYPDNFFGEN